MTNARWPELTLRGRGAPQYGPSQLYNSDRRAGVLYRVYVGRVELSPTVSAGWILIARRPDVGVSGTRGRRDVNVESPSYSEFCQLPESSRPIKGKGSGLDESSDDPAWRPNFFAAWRLNLNARRGAAPI